MDSLAFAPGTVIQGNDREAGLAAPGARSQEGGAGPFGEEWLADLFDEQLATRLQRRHDDSFSIWQ